MWLTSQWIHSCRTPHGAIVTEKSRPLDRTGILLRGIGVLLLRSDGHQDLVIREIIHQSDQTTFAGGDRRSTTRSQSLAIEEIHVFSPGLLNTLRLGFHRTYTVNGDTQTRLPGTDDPALANRFREQLPFTFTGTGMMSRTGELLSVEGDLLAGIAHPPRSYQQVVLESFALREGARDIENVLIPTTAQIDYDVLIGPHLSGAFESAGKPMSRFQRRDNALGFHQ